MSTPQTNHIRKIALIGGTGRVGSHFLTSLLATGQHEITALSRPDSTATFPPGVTVAKIDYTNETTLISTLRGHDMLIITISSRSPPGLHTTLVNAAAAAGVRYVMPNYYGPDHGLGVRAQKLPGDSFIVGMFARWIDDFRGLSDSGTKYVALCCGMWYEFSLGMGKEWMGFDIPGRKVTMYGDGTTRINMSTWKLCGEAVGRLVSLPVAREDGGDGAVVSDWDNKGLYISSFLVSQRDVLDSLHRVLGTTDKEWEIEYQDVKERYEEGAKEMKGGKMTGFAKALYARMFYVDGGADYETGFGLDNESLGLEKEDLDEATKRAVDMVNSGFGYRE